MSKKPQAKLSQTKNENPKEEILQKKDEGITQAKIEYDKITSFLKYVVGVSGTAITIIIAVGLSFTYKDAKEYKNELKERGDRLEERLKEETEKVSIRMKELEENYKATQSQLVGQVKLTKEEVINQIGNVKNEAVQTAKSAAKEKIEETFKNNNIEATIVDVAKKHLEPQITKAITEERSRKIDEAIIKMGTGNPLDANSGSLLLNTNLQYGFNAEQIEKLIKLYKSNKDAGINLYISSALSHEKNSESVRNFNEYILLYDQSDIESRDIAINYLLETKINPDFNVFVKAIETSEDKVNLLLTYIEYSMQSNSFPPNTFLNSKATIDNAVKNLDIDKMKSLYQSVIDKTKTKYSEDDIKKTYFYKKTQPMN